MSVFNDKLLVSSLGLSQLFFYSSEGRRRLSTITINDNDTLLDATWTPCGNVVYTTLNSKKLVVMSECGKVIPTHTQMIQPRRLSNISDDGSIYLADMETGVHQSKVDGVSWNFVFKSTDGWLCWQVIKVTTEHNDDYWTLETIDKDKHLRVYSVDRRHCDANVTWRDINVSTIVLTDSRLAYDGNMYIFLSDRYNKVVHVLSVNGQYHCQLLSSHHLKKRPIRLTVDKKHQLLYVGQWMGVGVFKLTYVDGG